MADIEELCLHISSGSEDAYSELWRLVRPDLKRVVSAKIGDGEAVADIMQETLLAIWERRARIASLANPRSWIFRVARNKIADYYRRGFRKHELPVSDDDLAGICVESSEPDSIGRGADVEAVAEALRGLPAPERTAVFLHYVWRFDYKTIANVYNTTPETIKRIMYELRGFIRRRYLTRTGASPDIMLPNGTRLRRLAVPELGMQYRTPGMERVRTRTFRFADGLDIDLYCPPEHKATDRRPAIIITAGYTDTQAITFFGAPLKDMEIYVTWAQAMASCGFLAITYNTASPENDVCTVERYVSANACELGIDPERLGLWACSGCAETALYLVRSELERRERNLRFVVFYYPVFSHDTVMPHMPAFAPPIPLLVVKVGQERPDLAAAVDAFITRYREHNGTVSEMMYEDGGHAFEMFSNDAMTRLIIEKTLEFMRRQFA